MPRTSRRRVRPVVAVAAARALPDPQPVQQGGVTKVFGVTGMLDVPVSRKRYARIENHDFDDDSGDGSVAFQALKRRAVDPDGLQRADSSSSDSTSPATSPVVMSGDLDSKFSDVSSVSAAAAVSVAVCVASTARVVIDPAAVRFYDPIPGTLVAKYSMFDRGDLMAACSSSDGEHESSATSLWSDASSVGSHVSVVQSGYDFSVESAFHAYPSLCGLREAGTDSSSALHSPEWFVAYLTGQEYEVLECLLQDMERELPGMVSSASLSMRSLGPVLFQWVWTATMASRFHARDRDVHTNTVFLDRLERVKRFVWSRRINVIEELLLEVPRILLRAALHYAPIPSIWLWQHDSRPRLHQSDVNLDPDNDPLFRLLASVAHHAQDAKTDSDRASVFGRHRLLAVELMAVSAVGLLDMGIECQTAYPASLVVEQPYDVLRVLQTRREALGSYITWLRSVARRNVQVHLAAPLVRFGVLGTNVEFVMSTTPTEFHNLYDVMSAYTLPPCVYFDVLAYGMDHRHKSRFGIKVLHVFRVLYEKTKLESVNDFVDLTLIVNPHNRAAFVGGLKAFVSDVQLRHVTTMRLDKNVVRRVLTDLSYDRDVRHACGVLVVREIAHSNPDWCTWPHERAGTVCDSNKWWLEDLWLAERAVSPFGADSRLLERVRDAYVKWIEPVEPSRHVCIGETEVHDSSACVCHARAYELCRGVFGDDVDDDDSLARAILWDDEEDE